MRTDIQSILATRTALLHRARFVQMRFELRCGSERLLVEIDGPCVSVKPVGAVSGPCSPSFTVAAPGAAWSEFARPLPPPGYHDLLAMLGAGHARFDGDGLGFYRNLFLVKGIVDAVFRDAAAPAAVAMPPPRAANPEPVAARYFPLEIQGRPHRVFVEEAGAGIPLLCLHTAGADARQYRHLLNDASVTRRFRVIAFDLPWHGRSSPPAGFQDEQYALTPGLYVDSVMAVVRGLGLERPVVMGCSIGGRAVLHLLLQHPEDFGAAIGLQASMGVTSTMGRYQRDLQYLDRNDVHGAEAGAALVSGTLAPHSPCAERWETLWHYMQAGPGVMQGDMHYYKDEGRLTPEQLGRIRTSRTPLYLLTGEYDYGASPERGREVARLVPGARFQVMPALGHFPPSENYAALAPYLLPVLDEIEQRMKT